MKRALLLTYTFPPLSTGGTPVVLNLCKYMPGYDWEIIPVTVENPIGMAIDKTLTPHIPKSTRVFRVPHGKGSGTGSPSGRKPPSFLKRILSFPVHNYILVPDRVITWKPAVTPVLEELIQKEKPHCIISFGPHHSLHLIAMSVCRNHHLPHIPFFGDLWLADSYVSWPSRINRFIEGLQENLVVKRARALIATTEGSTGYFMNRYEDNCPPTHVAENAYDPDRMGPPSPPKEKGEFLTAGWTGNFFADHSPSELIQGLEMFYGRNPDSRLRFKMAGDMDGFSRARFEREPLSGKIIHHGRLSWDNVPAFQKSCDLLITYLNGRRGSELKNSSKTAEYLVSGRTVLGIVPEGDMAERIRKYGRGYTVEPRADEIALKLENLEYQWKTSSPNLPTDYKAIEDRFSAVNVMKRLSDFLTEMAAP